MIEAASEKTDKKKPDTTSTKPKTEEQRETEALSKIATISDSVNQAKIVSSVKKSIDGEIRVKTGEVKSSEFEIDILESRQKLSGANVRDMISNTRSMIRDKNKNISELEGQLTDLFTDQGEKLRDVNEELTDSAEELQNG